MSSVDQFFHSPRTLRSTLRRLEHLALLDLPLGSRSVLEVGAGIGDLTSFFLDRDCTVTSIEARAANVKRFRERYETIPLWPRERLRIIECDVRTLDELHLPIHDIVFCYGLLNAIEDPEPVLAQMSRACGSMILLECSVISGPGFLDDVITRETIDPADPRVSVTGRRCIPTRRWLYNRLQQHFPYVYMTVTVPNHDRFRLDWNEPDPSPRQHRAIFVAARSSLATNEQLVEGIPEIQLRAR